MTITGLHLLLTYQCTSECDHCFVYGSPWQSGTMTLENVRTILEQARDLGTIKTIYFEGGEPFLHYCVMVKGAEMAAVRGFKVGIVSNAYWATDVESALECLSPLTGLVQHLSVSCDDYHGGNEQRREARNAITAAEQLGMETGTIAITPPERESTNSPVGMLPDSQVPIIFRGRAADKLAFRAGQEPWREFASCPHEDLRDPGRVHIDPLGNIHICQGMSLGNLFDTPLSTILAEYDPDANPITGPLLKGGPAELVRQYGLSHKDGYADACHLCGEARRHLRDRFPEILTPDQMYGVSAE